MFPYHKFSCLDVTKRGVVKLLEADRTLHHDELALSTPPHFSSGGGKSVHALCSTVDRCAHCAAQRRSRVWRIQGHAGLLGAGRPTSAVPRLQVEGNRKTLLAASCV